MVAHTRGQQWPAVLVALAVATSVCVALVVVRVVRTGTTDYAFLVWNLVLAWVPFMLAVGLWGGYHRGASRWLLGTLGVTWLLFLPNAPYIVTDFVHLDRGAPVPMWFDSLAIGAAAATGLLLGFASVYLIEAVLDRSLGRRVMWPFTLGVLGLASVGIYLGRFQRLNSWDALRHPHLLLDMARERMAHPLSNHTLLLVTVLFTLALTLAYTAICTYVLPRVALNRRRQAR